MVYKSNQKISGKSITTFEFNNVTDGNESNQVMGESESNQIKSKPDLNYDMDEDVDIGFLFENTSNIDVPKLLIDQVLGQEHAVEVVKKAASQRRHIMMIGTPGTGKSLLAKAMAELLPKEELKDILVYPNMEDLNNPKIREVPPEKAEKLLWLIRWRLERKPRPETCL